MTDSTNRAIAIIGAGLIGRSWAIVFARAGWRVNLTDVSSEARAIAGRLIERGLEALAGVGLMQDAQAGTARVSIVPSVAEAVAGVEFVQECIAEKLEVKREIFALLDQLTPPTTVLASSTSAIQPSSFTAELAGRARCLVAHPVNPPHLVPLVELCGAPWTAEDCVERAQAVYASVGQVPIIVRHEIEGFVLNRLQGALLSEALRLVSEGIVTPQDLDKTVKDGLGRRWSFMGPFETIELNAPGGIADYCSRYGDFYRRVASDPPSPKVWDQDTVTRITNAWGHRAAQTLKDRGAWRDQRLAALRAHLSEHAQE
jgi:L-gulonate 3-dehydrogenase